MIPRPFRGTRKKSRDKSGRRLTRKEKEERAAGCKHRRFRYRKKSTEAVCLDCGAVQKLKLSGAYGIEVVNPWALPAEPVIEEDDGSSEEG